MMVVDGNDDCHGGGNVNVVVMVMTSGDGCGDDGS
jgi:hypothetical protein